MILFFRRLLHSIAWIVATGAALLLLLSAYSYLVSPQEWVVAGYLGLAYPLILALNIGVLLLLLFAKPWYALIPLAALALSWGSITSYFPMNLSTPKGVEGGDSLVILTYNTLCFGKTTPHTEEKPNPILEYIVHSEADIVCLQEFGHDGRLSLATIERVLKPHYPYHSYKGKRANGMACYSKYPIVHAELFDFEETNNEACWYEIDIKGQRVALLNTHLESNRLNVNDKQLFKDAVKHASSDKLNNLETALLPKLGESFARRASQSQLIAQRIAENTLPLIVCGDFNDTAQSYAYRQIKGDLSDAVVESGFGATITYNERGFWFRIDHILYSKEFAALSVERGHLKTSDHYPLKATLQWSAPPAE